MSGVYIKGIEMPTGCEKCQTVLGCCDRSEGGTVWCRLAHGYIGDERTVCPLVRVPTPHGRLIDADTIGLTNFEIILCKQEKEPYKEALKMVLDKIEKSPTIILED